MLVHERDPKRFLNSGNSETKEVVFLLGKAYRKQTRTPTTPT